MSLTKQNLIISRIGPKHVAVNRPVEVQNEAGVSRALSDAVELVRNARSLVNIDDIVARTDRHELAVGSALDDLNGLLAVAVLRQKLARHRVEDHPLARHRSYQHQLTVGRELHRLHLLADVFAPHDAVRQSVPQLQQAISSAGDELRHVRMHGEAPKLVGVSHDDWSEAHVEVAGQNAVLRCSDQHLHAFALRHDTHSTKVGFNVVLEADGHQIFSQKH